MTISLRELGVSVVLLDIEGTTTPISFVYDMLFPYARARLRDHLSPAEVERAERLMDEDSKDPWLKRVQGEIWERGFARGELHGDVYPDVPAAFDRWQTAGLTIAIYSSGSVVAQRCLFSTTRHGDLTGFLTAFFDTAVGPKRSPESYGHIARALDQRPNRILFLSDVVPELDAAHAAGMHAILCVRPGNAPATPTTSTPVVRSFDEIVE